jgi:hypothetical protein
MNYNERHSKYPDLVIISYPFRWGGQLKDRRMWMAEYQGEVLDYDTKDNLIADAIQHGRGYVVLRVSRNFQATQQCIKSDVCNASDCKKPAVCAGLCEDHSF